MPTHFKLLCGARIIRLFLAWGQLVSIFTTSHIFIILNFGLHRIVTPRVVLTAAHCIISPYNNKSTNYVLVGRSRIQEPDPFSYYDTPYSYTYTVYDFRTHEYYNPSTKVNDIALVYTNNRMIYNAGVGPICTPPNGYMYGKSILHT